MKTRSARRLARCLLPAFLCAHIFIEIETSRYEAGLTCHQSRNRKHLSTATLSLLVSDHISSAMDKKQITAMVLIDLSKAFGSLYHSIPTLKITEFEFFYGSKVTLQTDNSSLVLHFYCQKHSLLHMTYPRAQFSAQRFSACTWAIYRKSSSLLLIKSYFGDTNIYFSFASKDIDSCLDQVAEDLQHFSEWCCANHLLINLDKTKFVLFGMRQLISKLPSNITVPFLGQDLVPVTSAKDLGITLNSNLTFNDHIASLTSSLLSTYREVQINRVPTLIL